MWIDRPIMTAEHFFFHLFSLPIWFPDDELRTKSHDIMHEYSSKDNLPEIRRELTKMKSFIGKYFIYLCFFIILNIIGDLYTLSIATNPFNHTTTKILIGIFISSGAIVFWLIFGYIFIIVEPDLDIGYFWETHPKGKISRLL